MAFVILPAGRVSNFDTIRISRYLSWTYRHISIIIHICRLIYYIKKIGLTVVRRRGADSSGGVAGNYSDGEMKGKGCLYLGEKADYSERKGDDCSNRKE